MCEMGLDELDIFFSILDNTTCLNQVVEVLCGNNTSTETWGKRK